MRRLTIAIMTLGLLAMAVSFGATTQALASSKKTNNWEATAGRFRSEAAASERMAALTKKGFSGYAIETENSSDSPSMGTQFEVEKEFSKKADARVEVHKLHKADFNDASLERS